MHLILGVNGVLIREPTLHTHVRQNTVQYIRSKIPECPDPAKLNSRLHKHYGNVNIGLKKNFNLETSDFNEVVYDSNVVAHLWHYISSPEFQRSAEFVSEIANTPGWRVTLFSNSPFIWSGSVARAIGENVMVINDDFNFKPESKAYSRFVNTDEYVYIDSSVKNLMTVQHLQNWNPIHFNPNIQRSRFRTLHDLGHLKEFLEFY